MNREAHRASAALAVVLASGLAPAQSTERPILGLAGAEPNFVCGEASISADGRFIAFESRASNLVANDTNGHEDVFVYDCQNGTAERVSVSSSGAQANGLTASISADGRFVAFRSSSSQLVAGDTNHKDDLFVRDRQLGTTERVSVATGGAESNDHTYSHASFSGDGRFVVFSSPATNLVPGDTYGLMDVFVRDRQLGTTERVSVSTAGAEADAGCFGWSMSADGRFVVFSSSATTLDVDDVNGWDDVFVRDRQNGTTELVSLSSSGAQGDFTSGGGIISTDGRFVAFTSRTANLAGTNPTYLPRVLVRDLQNGTTECVSISTAGVRADNWSHTSSISADGRFVTFESAAANLVAGDTNGKQDIFVHDRLTRTTERVSVDTAGVEANDNSRLSWVSADGRFVLFESLASNLVAGDVNGWTDVFLRDRGVPPMSSSCSGDGSESACPCGNSGVAGRGCDNSSMTGGALLSAAGSPSLSSDTLALTASGEKPTALSVFLQGSELIVPVIYGDGLRCAGGTLKRLYVVNATGGVATAPQGSDAAVSIRSAALGDPIPLGATRHYQTYYRDSVASFCPSPLGNTWNVTNALSAVWSP